MHIIKRRIVLLGLIAALLALPACQILGGSTPTIQNFPSPLPPTAAPPAVFDESACPVENGMTACPPESAIGQLGCRTLRPAGDVLAGLQPVYPLRVCLSGGPGQPVPSQFLYREGCLGAQYVRYVIQTEAGFRLLNSVESLQAAYAPIESESEALSYALATSGLGVRYGLQGEAGLRYFVDELQDTHVRRTEQGFVVHLFDYKVCGCGPHPTSAVDLLITFDGRVTELERVEVFEDPAEDDLCVD